MRMVKPVRMLWALGIAAVGLLALAGPASADLSLTYQANLSTERSGSVLIYPKVIWNGTRDTIIRISNTSNSMVHAHCFYVNASQQCNETDFDIWLTRQQPTVWVASLGRTFTIDSGLTPGLIPPVPAGFVGELKCIQVDESLAPLRANSLTGGATLVDRAGDVSQYNALVFQGNPSTDVPMGGPDLVLDMTPSNVAGGSYSACPAVLLFDHFTEGSADLVDSSLLLSTELTLVPCQEDLENQVPSSRTVQFEIFNEFEEPLSTSITLNCYLNSSLGRIVAGANNPFTVGALGTNSAYTRITPVNGGVIGMAEEFRNLTGAAAFNLEMEGYQAAPDHIILPQP